MFFFGFAFTFLSLWGQAWGVKTCFVVAWKKQIFFWCCWEFDLWGCHFSVCWWSWKHGHFLQLKDGLVCKFARLVVSAGVGIYGCYFVVRVVCVVGGSLGLLLVCQIVLALWCWFLFCWGSAIVASSWSHFGASESCSWLNPQMSWSWWLASLLKQGAAHVTKSSASDNVSWIRVPSEDSCVSVDYVTCLFCV